MAVISLFTELIDQYKIEQHLAQKSYTDLYLAFDVDENRQVVLDVLRPEFARDEVFARHFINRARAIAQIRHPNITPIYQVGRTPDNLPYVAQARIEGYSLAQRLAQLANQGAPVHSIYTLKLVRQLAEALLLAERLDMFHYELQPANVLLKNVTQQTDDALVLCDLFIPLNPDTIENAGDKALAYLSPEQREGKEVDAASHVYSLGVLLYEMLVGRPPTRPVQLWEPALRGLTAGATMLQRERDDLAAETYALVDRCLRREPRRRFQSIREFIDGVENAIEAERLRVSSSMGQAAQHSRRPWAVILTLAFLSLIVIASFAMLQSNNGTPPPTSVPTILAVIADDPTNTVAAAYPYPAGEETAEAGGVVLDVPTRTPTESSATADTPEASATAATEATATQSASATLAPSRTPRATMSPTAGATATETPTPQPAVRVIVPSANIRTGPGTDYRILGFLVEDEVVSVLAWNGEGENPWYVVLTPNDMVGWLAASATEPVTSPIEDNPLIVGGVPPAATIPAAPSPTPTVTPLPTFTPSPTPTGTAAPPPIPDPGEDGGGDDGGGEVDPQPTDPPEIPTETPPPLP